MAVRFTSIDLANEFADIINDSGEPVDLEGYHVEDIQGMNKSHPFVSYTIVPGHTTRFWTTPKTHKGLQEDENNLFWRNKNGAPRQKNVLNDAGDGLRLVSPDGTIVSSIFVKEQTHADSLLKSRLSDDAAEEEEQDGAMDTEQDGAAAEEQGQQEQDIQEAEQEQEQEEQQQEQQEQQASAEVSSGPSTASANVSFFKTRASLGSQYDPTEALFERFCEEMDDIEARVLAKYKAEAAAN